MILLKNTWGYFIVLFQLKKNSKQFILYLYMKGSFIIFFKDAKA